MKVIVLTRGGLPVVSLAAITPYRDVRLGRQKSAEAIVPRRVGGRAEQQRFWRLGRFERDAKKADKPDRKWELPA